MPDVYAIFHQPHTFTSRSGYVPMVEAVKATPITYEPAWMALQARSWTLGEWLRRFGNWYYGSTWNALVPWKDELRFARSVPSGRGVVHFLWGEFASPRLPGLLRRKGHRLTGTFHCGARRQASVLGRSRCIGSFDRLAVVSRSQIPFFVQNGFAESNISFLPLGVDTGYFCPAADVQREQTGPLRAILVGQTERDHEFMAQVMRSLPANTAKLTLCTHAEYHALYAGLPSVSISPRLADDALLRLYQEADVMVMPMLDCTANDAMLECMACGTPVLTNGVGGVPEYVDSTCNFVTNGKKVGEWVSLLTDMARNRQELARRRAAVRTWAETFGWTTLAPKYMAFYEQVMST
jgi:glycosyltransferase involved in cell wall biosynthesis